MTWAFDVAALASPLVWVGVLVVRNELREHGYRC